MEHLQIHHQYQTVIFLLLVVVEEDVLLMVGVAVVEVSAKKPEAHYRQPPEQ